VVSVGTPTLDYSLKIVKHLDRLGTVIMSNIFDNIKRLSAQQLISIHSLEKQAGIGNGVIRRWETSSPTVANLESVADVLGVSVTDLLRSNADNTEGR